MPSEDLAISEMISVAEMLQHGAVSPSDKQKLFELRDAFVKKAAAPQDVPASSASATGAPAVRKRPAAAPKAPSEKPGSLSASTVELGASPIFGCRHRPCVFHDGGQAAKVNAGARECASMCFS